MKPRVSIAMATYNGAAYIREQLDSLAEQTLPPFELVVSDDGSTDETLEIVEAFAQEAPFPVRIHPHAMHLGFGDNFLKAASLCSGTFIAFADQDDVWSPEKLETCLQAFDDREVQLVIHAAEVVSQDLTATGDLYPGINHDRKLEPLAGDPWWSPPGFAMVLRADLLRYADAGDRPANHLDSGVPIAHDQWAYFLAQTYGKVALLKRPLARYRVHDANTCGPATTKPLTTRLRESARTGASHYGQLADIARHRARISAHAAAAHVRPDLRARAQNAQHYWQQRARWLRGRATLHNSNRAWPRRLSAQLGLLAGRAYRSRDKGGFGLRALGKDLLFGLWHGETAPHSAPTS